MRLDQETIHGVSQLDNTKWMETNQRNTAFCWYYLSPRFYFHFSLFFGIWLVSGVCAIFSTSPFSRERFVHASNLSFVVSKRKKRREERRKKDKGLSVGLEGDISFETHLTIACVHIYTNEQDCENQQQLKKKRETNNTTNRKCTSDNLNISFSHLLLSITQYDWYLVWISKSTTSDS